MITNLFDPFSEEIIKSNQKRRCRKDRCMYDFVNSVEDIINAFELFYGEMVLLEKTDSNDVYYMKIYKIIGIQVIVRPVWA